MRFFAFIGMCLLVFSTGASGGEAMVFMAKNVPVDPWPVCITQVRQIPGTDIYRVKYPDESDCLTVVKQKTGVDHVEESRTLLIPDYLSVTRNTLHPCSTMADIDLLSNLGQGQKVTVSVIDTGISLSMFGTAVAINTKEIPNDGMDNDLNGYVDDYLGWNFGDMNPDPGDIQGHGTQVTSIVLSVAPQAKILPVKVTSGMDVGFSTGDAAEAIYYAVSRGADILNLSFSTAQFSYAIYSAVTHAVDSGCLVVAAAGNNGNTVQFPASMAQVIAVGSHDKDRQVSWFSPSGPDLDVLGLGENVCALDLSGDSVAVSGTSFSAPAVSGAAAVLRSMNPHLTSTSLKKMIFAGTYDIPDPGFDIDSGYGALAPDILVTAATPFVDVPDQVGKGDLLDVGIFLPPTDALTHVYLAFMFDNAYAWMDGFGTWFNVEDKLYEPYATLWVDDFFTQKIYGVNGLFGVVDTTGHTQGKYLWAAAIFDTSGNILAPIGFKEMALYP